MASLVSDVEAVPQAEVLYVSTLFCKGSESCIFYAAAVSEVQLSKESSTSPGQLHYNCTLQSGRREEGGRETEGRRKGVGRRADGRGKRRARLQKRGQWKEQASPFPPVITSCA